MNNAHTHRRKRGSTALLKQALAAGRDKRGNRDTRSDGWTQERIKTFLVTLAETGTVAAAAEAAGMSVRSAYALRSRAEGRAFHYAWEGALRIARRLLADGLMARAMHGTVDTLRKDGVVVGERHRYDNRLSMAMLTRLDRRVVTDEDEAEAVQIVVEEFDQFAEIASEGGAGASDFIAARRIGKRGRAEKILERLDNFARYRAGLPEEIDISDIDPAQRDCWTEDQQERARRSGLTDRLDEEAERAKWRRGPRVRYDGALEYFDPQGEMHWIWPNDVIRLKLPDQLLVPEADGNRESCEL
jgi:hypothetical protein